MVPDTNNPQPQPQAAPQAPVRAAVPAPHESSPQRFILPVSVVSRIDVGRMIRELGTVDEFLRQMAIRQGGQPVNELPRSSKLLEETAGANQLNLLMAADREALARVLNDLKRTAPTMHFSFASEPTGTFITRLLTWLRTNISPYVLVQVGLQPELAAGCMLRTTSKHFDLSVRKALKDSRPKLLEMIQQAEDSTVSDTPLPGAAGQAVEAGVPVPAGAMATPGGGRPA
jgi:hypothetical protein